MRLSLLILLFAVACKPTPSKYKKLSKNIEYKYIQFGEGNQPKLGEYIESYITITDSLGDTLHYVQDYPYFIKLQRNSPLDSAWCSMKVGDSISFKLSREEVNQFYKFYKVLESDEGVIYLHARLKGVYDTIEVKQIEYQALSKRELEEQKQLNNLLKELSSTEIIDSIQGIYRVIDKKVEGIADTVKFGSEVSIHYTGRFLNGYVFDNTYEKGITPTFIYGKEYQMIEGVKLGIYGMKVGEKAKIILPSRRAFGEDGSLAGIVPPYTAVIFEIEIIKVIN